MKKNNHKNWQSIFKSNGLDPKILPDVSMLAVEDRKPVIAQYIIQKVIKILNGDWVANYTNGDQLKYEPRFIVKADKKRPSGFGLPPTTAVTGTRVRIAASALLIKIMIQ